MMLGYVDDAPMVMVFEHQPGQQTVIDLSGELQKDKARTFIERFQEQSRQDMVVKLNEVLAA
jgi:anti-anti-sigma regulatory factor